MVMAAEWGKIAADEIIRSVGGRLAWGREDTAFPALCTDSRKPGLGELFWPLKGERYDGHDFIERALQADVSRVLASATWFGVPGTPVKREDREAVILKSRGNFNNLIGLPADSSTVDTGDGKDHCGSGYEPAG